MALLLDVNVLIARIDPRHEHHERVIRWEHDNASERLVTCPLTQNGFVRIYGHPGYPDGPGSPAEALVELRHLLNLRTHQFIADSVSLSDTTVFGPLAGTTPKQLTDVYLLGLAVSEGIYFATTDSRVYHEAVIGGEKGLHVIPPSRQAG